MRRVALFVEGHTELCFLREMILRYHRYSDVNVVCLELLSSNFRDVPYNYDSGGSFNFDYQIICTNGDAVISRVAERSKYLENGEFDLIIGLRDIYSQEYDDLANGKIDEGIITEMITFQKSNFMELVHCSMEKHLCFSRMEIEAWYLSMPEVLTRITGATSDIDHILLYSEDSQARIDVEKDVYRPAVLLNRLCQMQGKSYRKSREESNHLASLLEYEHMKSLLDAGHARFFNCLWSTLGW